MKTHLTKILVVALVLTLGVTLVVVSAREPGGERFAKRYDPQLQIGPTGIGDDPPDSFEVLYRFTGVYNKENDPEFATAVHCTNFGSAAVTVQVQFFDTNSGIPAIASTNVPSSRTRTFTTQTISSFINEFSAEATVDIQHGSGWVLAPPGSQVICTAQVLALENGTDVPKSSTPLDLFQQ